MSRAVVGGCLAAVVMLVAGACRRQPVAETPPHLIVVCIDTLRADHVGSWGYARPTTPAIDKLASRGTMFMDALAPSSWTVPSVASLFTSLPPAKHGAGIVGDTRRLQEHEPPRQIAPIVPTIAKLLARHGFRTGLFSANPFLYGRFKDGFETAQVERIDATKLTDASLAWLDRADSRPGFLYLQYMDAHQPNLPPSPFFQAFPAADGRPHELRHSDWSYGQVSDLEDPEFRAFRDHRVAVYDGAIRYVDSELARLFEALDRPPYRGRSIIVVTADHGEEFWDHALEQSSFRDDPRGIWGIGHGHTMFQELLHVPLFFVGPGVASGQKDPCPASLLDIAPTLLARTAATQLPNSAGENLWPRLERTSRRCTDRPRSASSPAYGPNSAALVSSGFKVIETLGRSPQLFDLRQDPGETRNLASSAPGRLQAMRSHIAPIQSIESGPGGVRPPENSELAKELRALGYL